jgi:hypothetical protein
MEELEKVFFDWVNAIPETTLNEDSKKKVIREIKKVNNISIKEGLNNIFYWTLQDWEENEGTLRKTQDIEDNMSTNGGSGWYSASLTRLKTFFDSNNNIEELEKTPELPFPEFAWYWANPGVVELYNDPKRLYVICKSIQENGNGEDNKTLKFSGIVRKNALEIGFMEKEADELAMTNDSGHKNVMASYSPYWKNLDLVYNAPTNANLTIEASQSLTHFNEFKELLKQRISKYKLPNRAILVTKTNSKNNKESRIKGWANYGKHIFPFKIIANIFKALQLEDQEHRHLTWPEVLRVIIPLSGGLATTQKYVSNILEYRNNPTYFDSWPQPQKCLETNGDRMANEFLEFLERMSLLKSNMPKSHYSVNKKYSLATPDSLDFIFDIDSDDNISNPEENTKPINTGTSDPNDPINKIYFGAPGTGKSFKIASDLKKKNVDKYFQRRITFHPDYDNASFLGAYKPLTDSKGDIKYEFSSQIFTNIFVDACNDPEKHYYLIIEEINRGNCAEIFGELFQLLDRDNKYPITPSDELIKYLDDNINRDTKYFKNNAMLLPDNVSILATMNTSDQSLFPMDSAFKRRWDWEYIPIDLEKDPDKNESAKYFIELGEKHVKWIDFIGKVNQKISNNLNLGMDKCLGNYFVKPDSKGAITAKAFINKVIFYLWNDVFKDEPKGSIFEKNFLDIGQDLTYESFFPIDEKGKDNLEKIFNKLKILDKKEDSEVDKNDQGN